MNKNCSFLPWVILGGLVALAVVVTKKMKNCAVTASNEVEKVDSDVEAAAGTSSDQPKK